MKIIRIILFIFFISSIFFNRVYAQNTLLNTNDLTNINIDSYSDDQIADMIKRASDSRISETQLYKILADKGLPSTEITKLKARIALITNNENQNEQNEGPKPATDENNLGRISDSASYWIPMQKFKTDETIFGSELFTTGSQVFEPNLRIPAPSGYILGPDDELVISIYGYSEKKYDLTVNDLGEIYIPNVGPILVNGLTIDQAATKITSPLQFTGLSVAGKPRYRLH